MSQPAPLPAITPHDGIKPSLSALNTVRVQRPTITKKPNCPTLDAANISDELNVWEKTLLAFAVADKLFRILITPPTKTI